MTQELPKIYDPQGTQTQAQALWDAGRHFHADETNIGAKGTYTIVIPPPNVTAALHLGHALNNTLQDILTRFHRMMGYCTLWMPGTDHAGIATQTVVEKRLLSEQGKRRTDFKREEFVAHVQSWKDEYETRILGQLKSMGCSCDWDRTRFTMDEVCAKAVRATFFKLFADGLIYRGKRLVNWDPATQTVLADDEVEHQTIKGFFWYLKYPLVEPVVIDGQRIEHITVATTRPETMLGDTAVAMNPADPRAAALVGQMVRLPIVGRLIPIVADDHVVLPNPESSEEKAKFSTGFLKVTPAHDPDDWQIGQRHGLEVINVMAPDGSISDKYGWMDWGAVKNPDVENLIGMDRFEAREAIVEWFRQENLLAEVRDYSHEVGHSYRSHVPIEPYLSDQWYIAVKKPIAALADKFGAQMLPNTDVPANSLAGLALKPLLDGRLTFYPERYKNNYQTWLENLRDWPISRQLWWGHQIPIWSKAGRHPNRCQHGTFCTVVENEQGTITYACVRPGFDEIEKAMAKEGWVRDADVLDTWFSSALWPFSTMGWPDDNPTLKAFYPTQLLCTAREIITLWVSRMVMMGQYCMGDIPFYDVYIHAMIQDGQGRKMSKSLGNGIDPLTVIDSHGADAMRFTLAAMTTDTQDVRMPVASLTLPDGRTANSSPKFDNGRNFCNKLWNASRFTMMHLAGMKPDTIALSQMDLTDQWILVRLDQTIREATEQLQQYKFNEPVNILYRFFWNDLCDWYLEWAKPRMADAGKRHIAQNVLAFVLDQTIRLLHPFVPFITEGIYEGLNAIVGAGGGFLPPRTASLMTAAWPQPMDMQFDPAVEKRIETIQNVVRAIRDIRSKYNIPPSKPLSGSINAPAEQAAFLNAQRHLICGLTNIELTIGADISRPANSAAAIVEDVQLYVLDVVDVEAEKQRLLKQKEFIENGIRPLQAKLSNEGFVSRAKPDIVEQSRQKLKELTDQLEAVENNLAQLG